MNIGETLLPEFDDEMKNTRKMLACVPDATFDYKPHELSMTMGRLASHVAELPVWAKHTFESNLLEITPGQKPFLAESAAALLEAFDKNVTEARELVGSATEEQLAEIWTLKYGSHTVMAIPRAAVYRTVVMNHMIHHRAQLSVYLRMNDVEIPGMYGPSANEMKFWQPAKPAEAATA